MTRTKVQKINDLHQGLTLGQLKQVPTEELVEKLALVRQKHDANWREQAVRILLEADKDIQKQQQVRGEIDSRISRLKSIEEILRVNLALSLERAGEKCLRAAGRLIRLRNFSRVVIETSPEDLPPAYKRVRKSVEADKSKIKKALLDGKDIPGARLLCVKRACVQ